MSSQDCYSAFVHRKDCGDSDLPVGQYVSFVYAEGAKGAAAKKVRKEEGGVEHVEEAASEAEEGERELGKVKVCSVQSRVVDNMHALLQAFTWTS